MERNKSFQSPSNRVKCSDVDVDDLVKLMNVKFQSPSNRVKCSDPEGHRLHRQGDESFNPLVIGSSVLMQRRHWW